jgi:hypothetical protein
MKSIQKSYLKLVQMMILLIFLSTSTILAQFNDANTFITASSGNNTPCPNDEVTYTISTTAGVSISSYRFVWTLPFSGGCFVQPSVCKG